MTSPTLFAPPSLLSARRVLAVQPHYDDNDIAAGGTLAALVQSGAEVHYLTVTDDLVGVLDQSLSDEAMTARLRAEQRTAGALIGVAEHYWLNYPDAGRYDHFDLRRQIIRHIRLLRPDSVFTCDPWLLYEAHQDHIRTGLAVAEAATLFNLMRLATDPTVDESFEPYELTAIVFYATSNPNTVFDISATREQKHRAIDSYRAQFTEESLSVLHSFLDYKEQEAASDRGFRYGEPLKVLRPFQLHVQPDTWRM